MPITSEKYDPLKIDKLKHYLDSLAAKGQAKPYEIFVDSLRAVPKTEDPKDFDGYEFYMNEDTEKIRILIYNSAASPRNDQYCFYMQQSKINGSANGLGEIETIVQEKLAARDREYEVSRLKQELEETKNKLTEAEEYVESLEDQLLEQKSKKFKLGNINMGELASVALEGFVRRNPQLLAKIPGGDALAGIIEQDTLEKEKRPALEPPGKETEVSFQKRDTANALSEEQIRHLAFVQQLEASLDQSQMIQVINIINHFIADPAQIQTVAELLGTDSTK